MKTKCTPEYYAEWGRTRREAVEKHLLKLTSGSLNEHQREFHLDMLALSYRSLGYVFMSNQDFDAALAAFRENAVRKCELIESSQETSAGEFQTILIALAINDHELVDRIVTHFLPTQGPEDSVFFADILMAIVRGEFSRASLLASRKLPKIDRQFKGYAECLQALASQNEMLFVTALRSASKYWESWVANNAPEESVCFIHGAGFVRLAERVFGHRVLYTDENIPKEILA